jgi:uncharacterized membrane protein (DUF373 family)
VSASFSDRVTHGVMVALDALTMLALAMLLVLALLGLINQVVNAFSPPFLTDAGLTSVLEDVLGIFVLVELLSTAVAYMRGTDVVRRMFETIFVAIARKLVAMELGTAPLQKALAVAILLLAAGCAWWLVSHRFTPAGASETPRR